MLGGLTDRRRHSGLSMSKRRVKFWRKEFELLDKLYRKRMQEWRRLIKAYDLEYKDKIRDLKSDQYVKVSEFYPLVRQIIATVAMNYPTMHFEVYDEEADQGESRVRDIEDLLARAASALLELTDAKPHVHQAIMDALFCGIGWLRVDFNPAGNDIIPPYVANDSMAEDLVSFSRVAPWCVHVSPITPPHMLGHSPYIRERMVVPLRFLKESDEIRNKNQIQADPPSKDEDWGIYTGELTKHLTDEQEAVKDAVENGEYVLVDRVHDRENRRLLMFANGVDEPILDRPHPFIKRVFDQRVDPMFGTPMFDPMTGEPMLDLETKGSDGDPGEPDTGWLVKHGIPFVPVKFDMHPESFYPKPHLYYIENLQNALVEHESRKANIWKRFSRQILVNQAEQDGPKGAEIAPAIQRGEDGEAHFVVDKDNFEVIDWGGVPEGLNQQTDRIRFYIDRITQVNELSAGGGDMTATEAALIGASASVNREWMEATVSGAYTDLVRNGFQIMGDPRFTPEAFKINVAPAGEGRMTRILTSADFLWNYKISVQAQSMQPTQLFEQMQHDRLMNFYALARGDENFDKRAIAEMLAGTIEIGNPEKLMVDDQNPNEVRAAQMENQRIVTQMSDPGVLPSQDHAVHLETHQQYRSDPMYQNLMLRAQTRDPMSGMPTDMQAAQAVQQIDAIMQQHMQQHAQAEQQAQQQAASGGRPGGGVAMSANQNSLTSQVRSNAQQVSQAAQTEAMERTS